MVTITEEHFAEAAARGISRSALKARVYEAGIDLDLAVKIAPIKRKYYPKEVKDNLRKYGISVGTFYTRVNNGWDVTKASTTPTMKKQRTKPTTQYKRRSSTEKAWYQKEYALYQNGEILAVGTIREIHRDTGRKIATLRWMTYPIYQKRIQESPRPELRLMLVELEDDDEEDVN